MELSAILVQGALPVLVFVVALGIAMAYNRLKAQHVSVDRDRASYLEVLEGSNDALFVINFVNGRIHQANQRAAELLGHTREQLSRLSIFDLHRPEDLHLSAVRIADAWEQGGAIHDDLPLVATDGSVIPVECSTRVTSYQGKPAIILFARDIRERVALQNEVARQQRSLREKNRELLQGIRYAQRIQRAVIPEPERLQDLLPDSFILFRPRDIVSGDFFWFASKDGHVVVAAADCTGHGVPGALLSVLGSSLLEQQVIEKGLLDPAVVLNGVRDGMITALSRNDEADTRDGMNAALLVLSPDKRRMVCAAGYAPVWVVRGRELIELKGDRMPVGPLDGEPRSFRSMDLGLLPGDRVYLFSDGLQDQFGGPQGKKLRSSGLKSWLLETTHLPLEDQYQALSDRFRFWKGSEEQVDDVLLIGIGV